MRQGVPFREAHEAAGACVRIAESRAVDLHQLTDEELASVDERITSDVRDVLTVEGAVASRATRGGTARTQVEPQRERVEQASAAFREWALRPVRGA